MESQGDTPISDVTGDVVITTYPEGAEIYMDGQLITDSNTGNPIKTPIVLILYMGLHDFRFVIQGYCDEYDTEYVVPAQGAIYVHRNFNIC